ncbi:MAG: hypothetical protein AMJ46_12470 [Latescibacteria bacterium DG_63]|nr:MAG: hypothetical protein AMJ46_12470 [Latescibacteria bacterium DG_63]
MTTTPSPCWFCHQPGGKQYLSREWDCGYHLECAQKAYREDDPMAWTIADFEDPRVADEWRDSRVCFSPNENKEDE